MQVKNRRQEKVCVSNLNFAFFKKEQKGKEQKERDKSRNPAGAIYCIPTEQNSFSVVIHIYHSIHNKSQYHGEKYFSVR